MHRSHSRSVLTLAQSRHEAIRNGYTLFAAFLPHSPNDGDSLSFAFLTHRASDMGFFAYDPLVANSGFEAADVVLEHPGGGGPV